MLLGPTGAGKTVLLECVAGLHPVDSGEVLINGQRATFLPPERRNLSYVPQDYVLFPHLSVFENIAFGLRLRRWRGADIERRVHEVAKMLGIDHLLARHPATLSGGEQQRTALARALVTGPTALLLDEPLSALDENTRVQIAAELRSLPEKFGTTVVHVCHSFEEALRVADRVAVIHQGKLVQIGTPDDIFMRPNCRFIAEFMRVKNILPVFSLETGESVARCSLDSSLTLDLPLKPLPDLPALLTVRPENVILEREPSSRVNSFRATVAEVSPLGSSVEIRVTTAGGVGIAALITRQVDKQLSLRPGEEVWVSLPQDALHLLPDRDLPEE